jgi:hypothetical protein
MSQKSPTGFFTSLIAEVVIVAAVVSILPRVPLGRAEPTARQDVADERPSLVPRFSQVPPPPEPLPPPADNWRTAVSRPVENPARPQVDLPPADPAYIEKRLDQASQQLLEGVSQYLSRQAQEVLQSGARTGQAPGPRQTPAFRPWPQ